MAENIRASRGVANARRASSCMGVCWWRQDEGVGGGKHQGASKTKHISIQGVPQSAFRRNIAHLHHVSDALPEDCGVDGAAIEGDTSGDNVRLPVLDPASGGKKYSVIVWDWNSISEHIFCVHVQVNGAN